MQILKLTTQVRAACKETQGETTMQIKFMNRVRKEGSKIKAFFSVETADMSINGCKLVDGTNGLFAAMPSREFTNNLGETKFQNIIYIKDRILLDRITAAAIREYQGEMPPPSNQSNEDIPF